MTKLITLLCTLLMLASCGGSSSSGDTTPKAFDGPPWHQFPAQEKARYESGEPSCGTATTMVTGMATWASFDGGSVVEEISSGVFIDLIVSPSGEMGLIQFKENEDGARVVELAVTEDMLQTSEMFMDFYVFRALDTGAASPDDMTVLNLATGKYFCVYNSNI